MNRKEFIKNSILLGGGMSLGLTHASETMNGLADLKKYTDNLPKQSKTMPILFTSHGNPMDIPVSKEDRPFWMKLFQLG